MGGSHRRNVSRAAATTADQAFNEVPSSSEPSGLVQAQASRGARAEHLTDPGPIPTHQAPGTEARPNMFKFPHSSHVVPKGKAKARAGSLKSSHLGQGIRNGMPQSVSSRSHSSSSGSALVQTSANESISRDVLSSDAGCSNSPMLDNPDEVSAVAIRSPKDSDVTGLYQHPEAVNSSTSIHLHDMRISMHLRSFSNFSENSMPANAAEHIRHTSLALSHLSESESALPAGSMPQSIDRAKERAEKPCHLEAISVPEAASMGDSVDGSSRKISGSCNAAAQFLPSEADDVFGSSGSPAVASLDGPQDSQLNAPKRARAASSSGSVGGNMDETTAIWGKALGAYQDNMSNQRTRSHSGSSRKLSVVGEHSRGSSTSSGSGTKDGEAGRKRAGSTVEFKPIDTHHTFNRLAVPGSFSAGGRAASVPGEEIQEAFKEKTPGSSLKKGPESITAESARLFKSMVFEKSHRTHHHHHLQKNPQEQAPTPDITVTDVESTKSSDSMQSSTDDMKRPRSSSSLGAWSRYPSHSREKRNSPAGATDNVVAKDFADPGIKYADEDGDPLEDKFSPEKQKAKARKAGVRKMIFVDLPKLLKPRSVGFHKGESGHRTSIATSGTLEFPKLELVSGGGIEFRPEAEARHHRLSVTEELPEGQDEDEVEPGNAQALTKVQHDRLPSSKYGSDQPNESSDGAVDARTDERQSQKVLDCSQPLAKDAKHQIGIASRDTSIRNNQTPTTLAIDHTLFPGRLQPEGVKILPPQVTARHTPEGSTELVQRRRSNTASTHPMRKSTQDLFEMMDGLEEESKQKALKTAETVWSI